MTNEELVQKAVVTTDALAAAGKLNPAQAEKFIDYVVQETVLKDNARIVKFRNEELEINKIGIGKRVAVPKAEAADPGVRRGVSTSKVVLKPREIMVPFEIGDNFKEINVEGEAVEEHIVKMMATQFANDVEELYINGDVLGPAVLESDILEDGDSSRVVKDTYLGLFDGWSRLSDGGNIVDLAGENVSLSVFGKMIRAMPTKFRRNLGRLRFFMPSNLMHMYAEKIASRATALGDQVAGGGEHKPHGVTPVAVPLWDFYPTQVQHVVLTGTTAVALRYAPIRDVVVTASTLNKTPTTPYVQDTDYVVDTAAGTIARTSGGAISSGATVKVTYKSNPQILLTHMDNFIVGIGRDIRIEKDRDIYKGVNQYAITAKVAVEFEELTAIVKGKNVGDGV